MTRTERRQVLYAVVLLAIISAAFMTSIVLNPPKQFENSKVIRVACVGDSITEGTEYPKDLQELLGPNYSVLNCGAGGTTALFTSNHSYVYSRAFRTALDFQPNVVLIMLGTNDANPEYFRDISQFVTDYKAIISLFTAFHSKIWILKPPPIFNDGLGPKSENLVCDVMPRIDQVACDLNLPTIDIYPLLINHPDYFWDGVHPDWQGAKIIAKAVYQTAFVSKTIV